MKVYETHEGMYNFRHLPGFAAFILEKHLDEYVQQQIELSYKINVPILKLFAHLTREQLFEVSKKGAIEFLTVLIENRSREYMENSLRQWATNQHELVGQLDIVAEDITLIGFVRQRTMQNLVLRYTNDPHIIVGINNEIADYLVGNNTSGTNTFINILTAELQRKRHQLLEAQTIAHVGSFDWDFKNVSQENSPEMRAIFETEHAQTFEEMLTRVHPEDRERVKTNIYKSMETGNYNCEFRYQINNKEKVLWAKGIVHYDQDGNAASMTGTVQDITDRKQIEKNLLEKTYELEISNANLEKFAYIASHDLQEPLRKILIHADILSSTESTNLSAEGKVLVDKILTSTHKLKNLVKDILNYSVINKHFTEKETVNLEDLLKEVKTELEHVISKKKATIISDGLPIVRVYPSQFKQLMQNIISNSLKFARDDKTPEIKISHSVINGASDSRLNSTREYLKLVFTDNGIGFGKDEAESIFALFKRLHSQREYEGSGLGLAICRKVVENLNGFIEASGEPGSGASFIVYLPKE